MLARVPSLERAVLFGSRAKGTHRPGSDFDLALVGAGLDWRTVDRVYDDLDDLLLPQRFSLVVLDDSADADVAAHIRRLGIPCLPANRRLWPPPRGERKRGPRIRLTHPGPRQSRQRSGVYRGAQLLGQRHEHADAAEGGA
jgi:uncharacterized protein